MNQVATGRNTPLHPGSSLNHLLSLLHCERNRIEDPRFVPNFMASRPHWTNTASRCEQFGTKLAFRTKRLRCRTGAVRWIHRWSFLSVHRSMVQNRVVVFGACLQTATELRIRSSGRIHSWKSLGNGCDWLNELVCTDRDSSRNTALSGLVSGRTETPFVRLHLRSREPLGGHPRKGFIHRIRSAWHGHHCRSPLPLAEVKVAESGLGPGRTLAPRAVSCRDSRLVKTRCLTCLETFASI